MSPSINDSLPPSSSAHAAPTVLRCPFDVRPVEPTGGNTRRLLVSTASVIAFASFGAGFVASYLSAV